MKFDLQLGCTGPSSIYRQLAHLFQSMFNWYPPLHVLFVHFIIVELDLVWQAIKSVSGWSASEIDSGNNGSENRNHWYCNQSFYPTSQSCFSSKSAFTWKIIDLLVRRKQNPSSFKKHCFWQSLANDFWSRVRPETSVTFILRGTGIFLVLFFSQWCLGDVNTLL